MSYCGDLKLTFTSKSTNWTENSRLVVVLVSEVSQEVRTLHPPPLYLLACFTTLFICASIPSTASIILIIISSSAGGLFD